MSQHDDVEITAGMTLWCYIPDVSTSSQDELFLERYLGGEKFLVLNKSVRDYHIVTYDTIKKAILKILPVEIGTIFESVIEGDTYGLDFEVVQDLGTGEYLCRYDGMFCDDVFHRIFTAKAINTCLDAEVNNQ